MNQKVSHEEIKTFVQITKDHFWRSPFSDDESGMVVAGSEGLIIEIPMIRLLPNLSDEDHGSIFDWYLAAKKQAAYLVLINGHLVQVSVSDCEFVRDDPSFIFEDEADHDQWITERLKSALHQGEEYASP